MPSVTEPIPARILSIRGHRVILDADLARLYDVPTFRLNEGDLRGPAHVVGGGCRDGPRCVDQPNSPNRRDITTCVRAGSCRLCTKRARRSS